MRSLESYAEVMVELCRGYGGVKAAIKSIITYCGVFDFMNYTDYVFKVLFENDFTHTLESYHFCSLTFD